MDLPQVEVLMIIQVKMYDGEEANGLSSHKYPKISWRWAHFLSGT